jgi:hypothetical protein
MARWKDVPQKLAECGKGTSSPGTGILGHSASHVLGSVTSHDAPQPFPWDEEHDWLHLHMSFPDRRLIRLGISCLGGCLQDSINAIWSDCACFEEKGHNMKKVRGSRRQADGL